MNRSGTIGVLFFCFCIFVQIASAAIDDGLIASYSFSGNANDESGNGNDGVVYNAVPQEGRIGSGYYLDGENDHITIANSTTLEVRSELTVAVWVKLESFGPGGYGNEHGYIVNKGNDLWWNPTYYLGYSKGSNSSQPKWPGKPGPFPARFHVCNETDPQQGGGKTVLSQTLLNTNQWYHLVGTYDGTELCIYVDGQKEASEAYSGLLRADGAPVHIGGGKLLGTDWGNQFTVNGGVDEVLIYNRALSEQEVQELYAETDDGLVAHYPFNGNAADESGNGYDGTVSSATLTTDRFGNADSAYDFDGINDRIDLPEEALNFERTDSYSKSFWIKTDDNSTGNNMIAKMDPFGVHRGISTSLIEGRLRIYLINSHPSNEVRVEGSSILSDNQWHHVVVTYDGSSKALGISLYVDGAPENTIRYNDTLTGTILNDITPTFGSRVSEHYYRGILDDICIYNRVLSEQEVQELYAEDDGGSLVPMLEIYTDVLTNTLVVAGEEVSRTITLTNSGNADLEFSFCTAEAGNDDSLAAYYPFSGNANDESGNGNDGVVYNAIEQESRIGTGYYLDGENDHITIANSQTLEVRSELTVAVWVKLESFGPGGYGNEHGYIVNKGNDLWWNPTYYLGYSKGSNSSQPRWPGKPGPFPARFHVCNETDPQQGGGKTVLSQTLLNTNQWYHLVGTYDGTELCIYVDGQKEASEAYSGLLRADGAPVHIGGGKLLGTDWGNQFTVNGGVDEVRIYNRALSEQEVQELYAETDDGLVAHYPFNGNAADESGNGYDGTVNGATLTTDRFGRQDAACHFDGVDDFIDLGLFDAGVKAVSMWIRQGVRDEFDFYFGHNTFRVYASTLANGRLTFGDGSPSKAYSTVSMDDYENQWVHVVAVGDGVNSKVYLNGVNVTESSGNVGPALASAVNLGRWPGPVPPATHYMKGDMDDVRIYDRILSESEVLELYAEESVSDCILPDWLTVEPHAGIVAPGASMDINLTYSATNQVAGDYLEHLLQLSSNDPEYPVVDIPVSMWVVPSVPEMYAEPQCTIGKSNEVAWMAQDGPVEYIVEAEAMQHCTPSSCLDSNGVPDGWLNLNSYAENPEDWFKGSGWIDSTSYWFTGLRLNNIYRYRVKASVVTAIGRLETGWSDWTASAQVPVIIDHHADHVPGWWKRWYFGTEDNFISSMDSDGDQLCDYYEYISGSNPHDAWSKFKIGKGKALQNGDFVVNWDSVTGRVYNVYWSPDVAGPYELLEVDIAYPQSSYTDTVHRAESGAFYRIDVRLDD